MEIADHIITYQGDVPQHGIYAGEGNVIYFDSKGTRSILIENMDYFCPQKGCFIRNYPFRPFSRLMSLNRAFQYLQRNNANGRFKNDEEFVAWCIKGHPEQHRTEDDIRAMKGELMKSIVRKIVSTAAESFPIRSPRYPRQTDNIEKYMPVIIGTVQLGIEIKKLIDANKT